MESRISECHNCPVKQAGVPVTSSPDQNCEGLFFSLMHASTITTNERWETRPLMRYREELQSMTSSPPYYKRNALSGGSGPKNYKMHMLPTFNI